MPLIVLRTIISAAYAAFRAHIKHEELTAAALGTAFILGILNVPFFGAPKSLGGPQIFRLNGPQYTLFLELVVNVVWSLSRRLNELKVALAIFAFRHGWRHCRNLLERLSSCRGIILCRRVGLSHQHFGTFAFWGLAAAMAALFYFPLPLATPFRLIWVGLLSPLLVLTGARVTLAGRLRRRNLLCGLCSSLPDILLGQRSLPSRRRTAEPYH